jgi:hypothetical protein
MPHNSGLKSRPAPVKQRETTPDKSREHTKTRKPYFASYFNVLYNIKKHLERPGVATSPAHIKRRL